jgi:quinol monooxygenase YgiN
VEGALSRREISGAGVALLLTGFAPGKAAAQPGGDLFGLIGEMKAMPWRRTELVGYLLQASNEMPGNPAYIVAEDAGDPDTIWITEVWRSKADHEASLALPQVREVISKARPIIAGFGRSVETRPVGFSQ